MQTFPYYVIIINYDTANGVWVYSHNYDVYITNIRIWQFRLAWDLQRVRNRHWRRGTASSGLFLSRPQIPEKFLLPRQEVQQSVVEGLRILVTHQMRGSGDHD